MKLTHNTIFITGGTSGIGRAMAEKFHQLGNQVIISGRREALLKEVTAASPGMDYVVLDVTRADSIQAAAQSVLERYPALNVVVNNAGVMPFDNAAGELDDTQAVTLLNTNLLGPVRVSAAFIQHLKQQPDAVLINNSSVLAFLPLATNALYSATKAAIHSYTLSQRFLLRDTGVQVIEISPPWVDTDLIYKSGDPRAMPLDEFISETFDKLGTDTIEAIVDRVLPVRDNPGADEHTLVNQFNQSVADNPIPVQ
ncbi:TPA: SDR family NAD(P)-dependent oxidoreductase [Klebsiella variicola subsp. variicola]|uniref:Oxidoreductase n=1 Tax=Klebsiella variicola TaxID=244366 RepID=A0A9P0YDQ6_KLEVA|nr:SDR family NAD(P)-dependent oxidoreductase [Klebsiella variicola]HCI6001204.1 SDR family NAD(P)-dependent oxidoreductase [Klebsiella variicola subsp. variicola]EIY5158041.1 SDR family NAD(P)-dependent oxidoreductase [Klebsiella variicola]NWO61501.1 SDR family NAD(P)-dependent oxidoreductase [Klebsiella variicola]CAH6263136.1 putative oxidoreductase [Klebsiella variicola]HDZ9396292.1 SDR family NAD(P)-dependent oxidoreductase [Klebsiella variicola subsp. variicola]